MYEKYATSLRMLNQIILTPSEEKKLKRQLFEELVEYMLANFELPALEGEALAEHRNAVDELLGSHKHVRMDGKVTLSRLFHMPPIVAEVVWPVYMLRVLVADLGIFPGHSNSSAFVRWAIRYAHLIIY